MSALAESPLATRRLEQGLSRPELAARAQCSQTTVKLVEQGWRGATPQTLTRIAIAVGMKPSEMY